MTSYLDLMSPVKGGFWQLLFVKLTVHRMYVALAGNAAMANPWSVFAVKQPEEKENSTLAYSMLTGKQTWLRLSVPANLFYFHWHPLPCTMLVEGIFVSGRLDNTGLWNVVAGVSTLDKDWWLGCCCRLAALRIPFCFRPFCETLRPVSMVAVRQCLWIPPYLTFGEGHTNIRTGFIGRQQQQLYRDISQVFCMCCRNTGICHSF